MIQYREDKDIEISKLMNLYQDAKWSNYTDNPELLSEAVRNSTYVLTAWDEDKLVGLIRAVGDGVSVIYVQDILVLTEYKRKKIGTILVKAVLTKYSNIRQKVLLTDESDETRKFYEKVGFVSSDRYHMTAFVNVK